MWFYFTPDFQNSTYRSEAISYRQHWERKETWLGMYFSMYYLKKYTNVSYKYVIIIISAERRPVHRPPQVFRQQLVLYCPHPTISRNLHQVVKQPSRESTHTPPLPGNKI